MKVARHAAKQVPGGGKTEEKSRQGRLKKITTAVIEVSSLQTQARAPALHGPFLSFLLS
jgi:hypothetical protein